MKTTVKMAGIIRNGLLSTARRLSNPTQIVLKTPTDSLYAPSSRLFSTKFSGSLWQMSSNNLFTPRARVPHLSNCKCGCRRSYSTDADEEMAGVLEDEITIESEKVIDLPKFESFKVTSMGGSKFELEKKIDKEKITIKVNINGAAETVEPLEDDEDDEEEMICRPDFEIRIEKKGKDSVLKMLCIFDKSDDMDEESDLFRIHTMTVSKGKKDSDDKNYYLQCDHLDPDLYRVFHDFIEARELDKDFAYELIDFATVYERQKYVELIENITNFVR